MSLSNDGYNKVKIQRDTCCSKINNLKFNYNDIIPLEHYFLLTGAGDLNINDPSMIAPDVCFQITDATGQEFTRSEKCEYDLKRTVEVEEGQLEASFFGIDGKEIKFDIKGRKIVRVEGEGMSRNWEGTDRGDLLVEIVVVQ